MRGILIYAIYTFGEILSTALVVRAIMSWFTQPNNYSTLGKIYLALIRFTEPIVAPCRNFMSRFNTGMIDFSLLIALLLIQFGTNILVRSYREEIMITPADIENKDFSRVKRGYDMEEVDDFLDLIIVDMEKLLRENRQLKEEIAKAQTHADQHMSTETSVYETLEAAKSLMNDIAASAERRAEILLKNAELEASLITKDAKDSISRLTAEGNRLKSRVEMLRGRYKAMLETELDRLDFVGEDILADFEEDFLPASMADFREELTRTQSAADSAGTAAQDGTQAALAADREPKPQTEAKPDLSKTIVARP